MPLTFLAFLPLLKGSTKQHHDVSMHNSQGSIYVLLEDLPGPSELLKLDSKFTTSTLDSSNFTTNLMSYILGILPTGYVQNLPSLFYSLKHVICRPQIQRFNDLVSGAADSLRTGGLGVFIEWDYQVYNPSHEAYTCSTPNYNPARTSPGFGQMVKPRTEQVPALVHFLRSVTRASTSAGSHVTSVAYLKSFLERSGSFRDVVEKEIWIPVVSANGSSTLI